MTPDDPNKYPPGWDKNRIQDVIDHYEAQSEDEAVDEVETALTPGHATIEVPHDLLPAVRDLIAKHKKAS